jgi:hypothetical protein
MLPIFNFQPQFWEAKTSEYGICTRGGEVLTDMSCRGYSRQSPPGRQFIHMEIIDPENEALGVIHEIIRALQMTLIIGENVKNQVHIAGS